MPLGFESIDALWIVLSVVLVITGLVGAYALLRLARALDRLSSLLKSAESSAVPLIDKAGGTIDRVNLQLDKVDLVTDSAVSAADSADTAVRAVSMAVTAPVQKVSSLATGISHGASAFLAGYDLRRSLDAGRAAARRRAEELAEELARKDRRLAAVAIDRPSADEAGGRTLSTGDREDTGPTERESRPERSAADDTLTSARARTEETPPA